MEIHKARDISGRTKIRLKCWKFSYGKESTKFAITLPNRTSIYQGFLNTKSSFNANYSLFNFPTKYTKYPLSSYIMTYECEN